MRPAYTGPHDGSERLPAPVCDRSRLYLSVALGILGTIAAARILGLADFGRFATVMAVVGLAQTLLDLTVEESLTKFGFRYVAAEDWGSCTGCSGARSR